MATTCMDTYAADVAPHATKEATERSGDGQLSASEHDLCSTDSGTSYSSATSSASPGVRWSSGSSDEKPDDKLQPEHQLERKVEEAPAAVRDPRSTNLNHFHAFSEFDSRFSTGHFTMRKHLADCCRGEGKVQLQDMQVDDGSRELVVVKKLPVARVNANKGKPGSERALHQRLITRDAEDPLAEIGVFSYLMKCEGMPQYILQMRAAFQAESDVWLILENADGGDLFGIVQSQRYTARDTVRWMWQLMQAVKFLHVNGVGHRDISLENVLLCNGNVRLMDFGQAVQTCLPFGELLRYFIPAGKPYYRPPETYIPFLKELQVVAPAGSLPGQVVLAGTATQEFLCHVRLPDNAVPGAECYAEPYGYTVPPIDVFACAVCMVIMVFHSPPWRQARIIDGHFKWIQANGIGALAKAWQKTLPSGMSDLIGKMLSADPAQRPSVDDCLSHEYFASMRGTPIATHESAASGGPAFDGPVFMADGTAHLAGDCYMNQHEWICRSDQCLDFEADTHLAFDSFGDPYKDDLVYRGDLVDVDSALCDIKQVVANAPGKLALVRERKGLAVPETVKSSDLDISDKETCIGDMVGAEKNAESLHLFKLQSNQPHSTFSSPAASARRTPEDIFGVRMAGSPSRALRLLRKSDSQALAKSLATGSGLLCKGQAAVCSAEPPSRSRMDAHRPLPGRPLRAKSLTR